MPETAEQMAAQHDHQVRSLVEVPGRACGSGPGAPGLYAAVPARPGHLQWVDDLKTLDRHLPSICRGLRGVDAADQQPPTVGDLAMWISADACPAAALESTGYHIKAVLEATAGTLSTTATERKQISNRNPANRFPTACEWNFFQPGRAAMSSGTPTAGWPARTPRLRWVWWGCGTRPRRWMAPCARPVQDARFQLLLKLLAISSGAPEPVRKARVPRGGEQSATGADPLSEGEIAPPILGLRARLANFLVVAIKAIGVTGKTMLAADEREVVDVACVRLCLGVPKVGRQ